MSNSIEPWKEVSRETLVNKFGRGVDRVQFQLPNGKTDEYYINTGKNVAAILALTKDNRVLLAKQFRPGPEDILLELPGGAVEEGEDPLAAAERELLEETGYKGEMSILGYTYEDAYTSKKRFAAVALGCEKVAETNHDHNEFIEVITLPLSEFRELLKTGKLTDTHVGYMGLDRLGMLQ